MENDKLTLDTAKAMFNIDKEVLLDDIEHCHSVIERMECCECKKDHERLLRYMEFIKSIL